MCSRVLFSSSELKEQKVIGSIYDIFFSLAAKEVCEELSIVFV